MILEAKAKVNLSLAVTGRRNDGYHILETIVAFADLHDSVTIEKSSDLELEVHGSEAEWIGYVGFDDNIAVKAARALALNAGIKPEAKIIIEKNIPAGAGLGGGSADAAAVLVGLNDLWQLNYTSEKLSVIGLRIGADVPMCLFGGSCLARGIGDEITPLQLPEMWTVLVNPRRSVSTAEIFKRFDNHHGKFSNRSMPLIPADLKGLLRVLEDHGNDLTPYSAKLCPEIAAILAALADMDKCLLARMSGSGATCFGLFEDETSCNAAAAAIAAANPRYWVQSVVIS